MAGKISYGGEKQTWLDRNRGCIITFCAVGIALLIGVFYVFQRPSTPSEEKGFSKFDAVEACKEGILAQAAHPSTVRFTTFDYDFNEYGDGRSDLLTGFTAKNSFNLEIGLDAQCQFQGDELKNVVISEARQ